MKRILSFLIAIMLFASFTQNSYAKKVLPQKVIKRAASSVSISVKFRRDRRAINVFFSNLQLVSSVNYVLSYSTRGTTQGAGGSIDTSQSGGSVSREIIFGTCSHGVCRYDTGITDAKLVVTQTLKNGKRSVRTFKLRV